MRLINADALIEEIHSYTMYDEISKYDIERAIDEAPTVDAEPVVHCEHCTNKKAVQHKDGIVWRCPHRTDDVKMEGFCESGVR